MAKLPDMTADPTLEAVDRCLEERGNAEQRRGYLGTHDIGHTCERRGWYGFRWASSAKFDAATLKKFEDGHRGEDLQAERLQLVEGVELRTVDPDTGRQFAFQDHAGHWRGHCDGVIKGILQAPSTAHVWEHKQTAEKQQAALLKAKGESESEALAKWSPVYYAQAQVYMGQFKLTRHYLTCASPGGRHTVSVRTHFDKDAFEQLRAKALRLIEAKEPPERIKSASPAWHECKMCPHASHCVGGQVPEANCRTCCHSTPVMDGDGAWRCEKWNAEIPFEAQAEGCPSHLFIPSMMPWDMADADTEAGWVEYELRDGRRFRNGAEHVPSKDLATAGEAALDETLQALKKSSAGSW